MDELRHKLDMLVDEGEELIHDSRTQVRLPEEALRIDFLHNLEDGEVVAFSLDEFCRQIQRMRRSSESTNRCSSSDNAE